MPYKSIEKRRKYARDWAQKNRPACTTRATRWNRERQLEAIAAYGGSCACCGEDEPLFLAIDHIDSVIPDGVYMTGAQLWTWLRNHDWPSGFRVLCHNCNFAVKGRRICPHQQ